MLCFGKHLISSVPSKLYAERFYKFMRGEVIIDEREDEKERNRLSLRSSIQASAGENPSFLQKASAENTVLKRITSQA